MAMNSYNANNVGDVQITSTEEFDTIIGEFESSCNKIRNIIDREKKNAEKLNGNGVWTGKAGTTVYGKYALLNSNYEQIDLSLQIYTSFLKKTSEDYKLYLQEVNKNVDAMSTSLDVNS